MPRDSNLIRLTQRFSSLGLFRSQYSPTPSLVGAVEAVGTVEAVGAVGAVGVVGAVGAVKAVWGETRLRVKMTANRAHADQMLLGKLP